MKKLVGVFNDFADSTGALAANPKTLTFSFVLAAMAFPFSREVAAGAAIAPTLLAGSSLMAKGASKAIQKLSMSA